MKYILIRFFGLSNKFKQSIKIMVYSTCNEEIALILLME